MSYIRPQDVSSPVERWRLRHVLLDDGPSRAAIAFGVWDDHPTLVMRWNGSDEAGGTLGNPQSRGNATWFVLPRLLAVGILQVLCQMHLSGHQGTDETGLRAAMSWLREDGVLPHGVFRKEENR